MSGDSGALRGLWRWPGDMAAAALARDAERTCPLPSAVGFAGSHGVSVHREERGDDTWVELACSCALDLGDCSAERPRGLVGPLVGERVKDVGHGDHAADERDGLAG